MSTSSVQDEGTNVRVGYDQLCRSYHAIDDFRGKLLGFLPLVTGGGLVLLTGRGDTLAREFFLPVGIFGLLMTLGLFTYEIYGIKKCHALIKAGTVLESELDLTAGQFQNRPREVLGNINEPFAAAIIYPGVMCAWAYLAMYHTARQVGGALAILIFLAGFAGTLEYNRRLRNDARQQTPDMYSVGGRKASVTDPIATRSRSSS
jgi:hypothetical protein